MRFLLFLFLAYSPAVSAMKIPQRLSEDSICAHDRCKRPDYKYELIADIQPGYQWNDAGGYCGSWASQRAILGIGAWISQQAVRDHTEGCGGHDEEILSCNIEEAWTNLKIDYEAFDYKRTEVPQTAAYFMWLKQQLVAGNIVAWMIMWDTQTYPIYNLTAPEGMYGHVEPVIGILSNHPLDDATVYDDDMVAHYTDGGVKTVYRVSDSSKCAYFSRVSLQEYIILHNFLSSPRQLISTLPCSWDGEGQPADCGDYSYGIGDPYGFGWAAKGFTPDIKQASAAPAFLHIQPWLSEPDTRSGEEPEALLGTLTATHLTEGVVYDIFRWDTVGEAFTYQDKYRKTNFTATSDKFVYIDSESFQSDGTTYYRVVRSESNNANKQ